MELGVGEVRVLLLVNSKRVRFSGEKKQVVVCEYEFL